jgi:hypothetical protein
LDGLTSKDIEITKQILENYGPITPRPRGNGAGGKTPVYLNLSPLDIIDVVRGR